MIVPAPANLQVWDGDFFLQRPVGMTCMALNFVPGWRLFILTNAFVGIPQ